MRVCLIAYAEQERKIEGNSKENEDMVLKYGQFFKNWLLSENVNAICFEYAICLVCTCFCYSCQCSIRLPNAKLLPGVNRLMKHLQKHGVPLALASNSKRANVDLKFSYHQGCLFRVSWICVFMMSHICSLWYFKERAH